MTEDFPHRNLMVRVGSNAGQNEKPLKNREQVPHRDLCMSDAVHDIVVDPRNQFLKLINVGLPVLMNQKPTMFGLQYRLAQEGIPSFYPFIRSRAIEISLEDLKLLLSEGEPFTSKLGVSTQEKLRPVEPGPCLFVYKDSSNAAAVSELVCSGNRSSSSVRVQMKDSEKKLLHQLFVDAGDSTLPTPDGAVDTMEVDEKEEDGDIVMKDTS